MGRVSWWWHGWHKDLLSRIESGQPYTYPVSRRQNEIREDKPKEEQKLRLLLFRRATLPRNIRRALIPVNAIPASRKFLWAAPDNIRGVIPIIDRLHRQQCHPRCPVRTPFKSIFRYKNPKTGEWMLQPKRRQNNAKEAK